jgi:hypothetical protein
METRVVGVFPLDRKRLQLEYSDGTSRIFDMTPLLGKGLFRGLLDEAVFRTVRVVFDTVEWANGADIDPETLLEDSVPASAAMAVAEKV